MKEKCDIIADLSRFVRTTSIVNEMGNTACKLAVWFGRRAKGATFILLRVFIPGDMLLVSLLKDVDINGTRSHEVIDLDDSSLTVSNCASNGLLHVGLIGGLAA